MFATLTEFGLPLSVLYDWMCSDAAAVHACWKCPNIRWSVHIRRSAPSSPRVRQRDWHLVNYHRISHWWRYSYCNAACHSLYLFFTCARRYCDPSCLLVSWFFRSFINIQPFSGQISHKWLEIEAQFQWITNRKWHMVNRMVTCLITPHDLERWRGWPR